MVVEFDRETLDLLRRTPTGIINDALGLAGVKGAVAGIRPARGFEDMRIAGPALTIDYAPAKGIGAYPRSIYEVYYEAAAGQVVVMAGHGADYAFTGDNQAHAAKQHGIAAIVIDGGARDVAGIRAVGMPLFITAPSPRVHNGVYDVVGVNVPVQIGGVQVNPGDVVVGDEDGIVVIPQQILATVVENVRIVTDVEDQMEIAIKNRRPVEELKALLAKKKFRPAK